MDSEWHVSFEDRIGFVKIRIDRRRGDGVLNLSNLHSRSELKLCYVDHQNISGLSGDT